MYVWCFQAVTPCSRPAALGSCRGSQQLHQKLHHRCPRLYTLIHFTLRLKKALVVRKRRGHPNVSIHESRPRAAAAHCTSNSAGHLAAIWRRPTVHELSLHNVQVLCAHAHKNLRSAFEFTSGLYRDFNEVLQAAGAQRRWG